MTVEPEEEEGGTGEAEALLAAGDEALPEPPESEDLELEGLVDPRSR